MNRRTALALVAAWTLASASRASEDEAWLERAHVAATTTPLLALVVDTSEAMGARLEVPPPYDASRDYISEGHGACRRDRVYWRLGSGPPPACDSAQWVPREPASPAHGWRCAAGHPALESAGVFIASRAAQWTARGSGGYWGPLVPGEVGAVECRADRGRHGSSAGPWFAADGAAGPWSDTPEAEPDWQAPPLSSAYLFYTGNYLAYLESPERVESTRYDWLARRVGEAARAASRLEVAVARFSHDGLGGDDDARGGMLALAPERLPDGAAALEGLLAGWTPSGPAPIAETLVEMARWLRGEMVAFGDGSQAAPGTPFPSVPGTRLGGDPTRYRSPFDHACRPVLTAIASAGQPSADAGAGAALAEMTGRDAPACGASCLDEVTTALVESDLSGSLPGRQRTAVRWLLAAEADPAARAAARAAGDPPLDLDAPEAVLSLWTDALQHDAAEPGGVRVSAAGLESRTHAAADDAVYLAFSKPVPAPAWPGNLRRYRLLPASDPNAAAEVVGRDGRPAFDERGRLQPGSSSHWSATPDGADPMLGGAAGVLPGWQDRLLFSDLVAAPLDDPRNRLAPGNALLTRERLGLTPADERDPGVLIEWMLGRDAFDADFDGDRLESRHWIGDGGRRSPRVLRYAPGGAGLAFLATHDGLLHAFDADTGVEQWAFAPAALLDQAAQRSRTGLRFNWPYGLDGAVELVLHDANRDGRIEPAAGDQAWLFVGLGRGGTGYYGLDVTDPEAPRLLWRLDAAGLPGFGESWPAPVPARMRFDPAVQGDDTRVLVLAGGHDPAEDAARPPVSSRGAGLAIVAAASGTVLWRAGGPGDPLADLEVPGLGRSLPAAPQLLDTDGDGFHDRAYVLDVSGQLLRFDFVQSGDGAAVASARRVADLGEGAPPGHPRRFQSTPDAVLERRQGRDVIALAFGSGWTSRPRSPSGVDRFYVVFDDLHGAPPRPPIDESVLVDVTDLRGPLPADATGWFFRLAAHGEGEKVTGHSLTFDHRVRFTTYQPLPPSRESPCGPPAGVARLYTLDIRDGSPVNRVGDRPVPDEELDVDGLAPELVVSFPAASGDGECPAAGCRRMPTALLGGRSMPLHYGNEPVRTSWRQLDADAE